MAEGLALATCLGKLNIVGLLELLLEFLERLQLQPHQGGSVGHIHCHCHTELKCIGIKVTCHLRHSSLTVGRIFLCDHMQDPANVLSPLFLNTQQIYTNLAFGNTH